MKNAITVKNLEKKYENFTLKIDELNIPSGQIIGLIGENGAGKTTFIKSILNIIQKDHGDISVFEKSLKENELAIKNDIGVVLDEAFFPDILNAKNIDSIMKDMYQNWDSQLFHSYLKEFGIQENQMLKTLSKGMKKKVEIATALSHHPKLLILDEATSGLDPIVRNDVLDLFLKFIEDDEHTILLSTHITSDLEHVADHIVFIDKGRIILENSRNEITDYYGILKCDVNQFETIDKEEWIAYKKNKYDCEVLIKDREKCKAKYPDFVIDKITLEDLMLLMIRGVK